ncbi:hypothetical protein ASPFODRAFT_685703 [Aspergillus luchuensis CBS 106.47]|uniref:Uncharacterized protein n=1 Tax=Aspergillus luchuensis (strain CBS 106.47) TaxID=1137211 RepID=A0A1M3TCW0_ASPLC|nr:hypothetical protein ASPFODRAFT_685703 [Aspergillus luchuensis CBS 106.47]
MLPKKQVRGYSDGTVRWEGPKPAVFWYASLMPHAVNARRTCHVDIRGKQPRSLRLESPRIEKKE